jgi:hypothetical protein
MQEHEPGLGTQVAEEEGEEDRRQGSQGLGWHDAADDDATGFLGEGDPFGGRLGGREDGDGDGWEGRDDAAGFLGGLLLLLGVGRGEGDAGDGRRKLQAVTLPALAPGWRLAKATGAARGAHVVCVWREGEGVGA